MRPTVLLFDIDGTLVTTGGAGRRAMRRGFASIHGSETPLEFPFDGMTDRSIARRGLENLGLPVTVDAIDTILSKYLGFLHEEVERVPTERYRVHNGMREAVERARGSGMAVGLGTGNIRDGARVKLERVGLFEPFQFGGFGCDAEVRVDVIRIGADRGAALLGVPREDCRVVVIGDTPKDVDAARGIGAECIGVGTGTYTPEVLLQSGATHAFRDFSEAGALQVLLERTG